MNLAVYKVFFGKKLNNFTKLNYKQLEYQNVSIKRFIKAKMVNHVHTLVPVNFLFNFEKLIKKAFLLVDQHPSKPFTFDCFKWLLKVFIAQLLKNDDQI